VSQHPPDPEPPVEPVQDEQCAHSFVTIHDGAGADINCESCGLVVTHGELVEAYEELQTIVKTGLAVITGELEEHRADLVAAAGELRVSMPKPGTDASKVLRANYLLRQNVAKLHELNARLSVNVNQLQYKIECAIKLIANGCSGQARADLIAAVQACNPIGREH
jgi:hypothetical protein